MTQRLKTFTVLPEDILLFKIPMNFSRETEKSF